MQSPSLSFPIMVETIAGRCEGGKSATTLDATTSLVEHALMTAHDLTRAEKKLVRDYALQRECAKGENIVRVRLLASGDVRAYCKDGSTYLIAPTTELFAEAREALHQR